MHRHAVSLAIVLFFVAAVGSAQTNAPSGSAATAKPAATQSQAAGTTAQGAGTPGAVARFVDTVNLGDSIIFQAGSNVGIGTTAPAAALHSVAAAAPGAIFDVYSNSLSALPVVYRAARGTPGAPSAVQADDILGGLAVRGYAATGFTSGRGQVMFRAAENWTDTANGTYLQLTTTPIGSAGWVERMRITPAGYVGIGTATPGQMLTVAGTIESTAGGFRFPDGTTQTTAALSAGTNSAFGYLSLTTLGSGTGNSAFGAYTLQSDTTGDYNQGFGYAALWANSTGSYNAAFGYHSLLWNTAGSHNNAFGAESLADNTSGAGNNAFGSYSLTANTTGTGNDAFGYAALTASTTPLYNSAFGYTSLASLTTGGRNTGIGPFTGFYLTTGNNNTFLGYNAGPDAGFTSLSNATAIGSNAVVRASNALVLGGIGANAVNVGIGTPMPDSTLQVYGDIKVGAGANGCVRNFAGTAIAGACSSDGRLKTNIRPFEPMLARVARLQPVWFDWRVAEFPDYHFGDGRQSGLIAQQVEPLFPEMVATDARGYKTVNYSELPYLTLAAVKELKAENDALKAQLEALQAEVRRLAAAVAARPPER